MPHCCVSQVGLEKLLFQTKKDKYLSGSYIAQASTFVSGQAPTKPVSFGWVSGFQVCLPARPSHFSQLSHSLESGKRIQPRPQNCWGEGGAPHAWSQQQGLGRSEPWEPPWAPGRTDGVVPLLVFCHVKIILVSISAGPQARWTLAAHRYQ